MMITQIRGGLAGRILRVDLSRGRVWSDDSRPYASRFIGGRAVNSALLWDELPPETHWSDSANPLIFGVGALVGTAAPAANRMSIETRSTLTGGKGSANVGGHFPAALKYAGFDHVVVTGKSAEPVYLWIRNGTAELRDARCVWGQTVTKTERLLADRHRPHRIRVACIGPAGENGVRGSAVICDRAKSASGSGVGCVMGTKGLKALVVCAAGGRVDVARPTHFMAVLDTALDKVRQSPMAAVMRRKTLAGSWADPDYPGWNCLVTVRNGQDDFWPSEKRVRLGHGEHGFHRFRRRITACTACPIGCMPLNRIDEGPYAGSRGEGFWVNGILNATRLDITAPDATLKAWMLANELGLDADFGANVCSWAFECYQRGLLTPADTDGLELTWGNAEAYIALLQKVAAREGIGELLSQGVKRAAVQLGHGSDEFAIHMKGQDVTEAFRAGKGWALGMATSPVGGKHLRGACLGGARFGPKDVTWEAYDYDDQAQHVIWQAMSKEMEDMLGLCIYIGTWAGAYALEVSDYTALLNATVGCDLTEEDLFQVARRGYNLEKAFNTLHAGFGRRDDDPPRRYMHEEVKAGPFKGYRLERENWDPMLDEFYGLLGWAPDSGLQTRSCLVDIGLEEVAERLAAAGKLAEQQPGAGPSTASQ